MDDSCAVCAETLEWVAYGPCGHKEVCSTCVSRLRFICEDRKCCICKTESDIVFITKALGDYTKIIGDFSVLPSDPKEGKVGSYWYHEDVQAYFDDVDHYKMIIAMCRLSCSVCDNMEDDGGPKRKAKFKSIEQLKGHLYHQHKLFMCSLCLEGRKIFICEHKLYTRAQLNQHINSGDSEVDGSESERGGFMGHPMCDFCKRPFYGDNELYTHMSTEHFTCHICQRQHPGQYDYFKNYDDLEIHFRQQHFLCEDDACLAKKFIVFQSESEMKRHNALEHGGQMSRSKRNAALQIPTSFRYRLYEQENRRGRGRGSHSDSSQSQLAMAIQASLETANSNDTARDISSGAQSTHAHIGTGEIDNIIPPMESLGTSDSEQSLRYRQAVSLGATSGALMESAFPPLVGAPRGTQQNSLPINKGLGRNTMAARIGRKGSGSVKVLNAGPGLSGLGPSSKQSWPVANYSRLSSSSSASSSSSSPSSSSSSSSSVSSTSFPKIKPATSNPSAAHARLETTHGIPSASSSSSSWVSASKAKVGHSTSTPNLVERGRYLDSSMSDFPPVTAIRKVSPLSDFPPVTATRKDKLSTGKKTPEYVEDVQTANKSLVERMRSALEFDENKFNAFKEISGEFRQNLIGTGEYLSYVQQFGLSHLVLELARLCPDSEKQRELLETYNASVRFDNAREKSSGSSSRSRETVSTGSSKGKGKQVGKEEESLSDSILNTVRKLQANNRPTKEEVEVLSKDGYRISKGKSTIEEKPLVSTAYQDSSGGGKNQNPGGGGGGGGGGGAGKKKKRISKFERVRLGDGVSDLDSGHGQDTTDSYSNSPSEGIQVRGAWNNGGGQKLVAMTQRGPRAR